MCKVYAICNQKGGCSKTSVTVNLGIGLAMEGKRVAVIDADPQGSLTISLGYSDPDELPVTLATIMTNIIDENDMPVNHGMLHHQEGMCCTMIQNKNMDERGLKGLEGICGSDGTFYDGRKSNPHVFHLGGREDIPHR